MAFPSSAVPVQSLNAALQGQNYQVQQSTNSIKDLAYKAFVVCHDENIVIDAWLPEQVSVDVHADYDPPYAQGLGGDGDAAKLAKMAGVSLTTQALTIQVWQGGSYIQFSLPFIFQAESNGATDVMGPIKKLMRLMMPKEPIPGGLLEAPGPRLDPKKALTGENLNAIGRGAKAIGGGMLDATGSALTGNLAGAVQDLVTSTSKAAAEFSNAIVNSVVNNISLYIGQFQYFPSVVITDVSPTYDVVLGPDKNPVRASVVVQFKTFYVPTQRDIDLMFPSTQTTTEGTYGGVSAARNNSAAARG